MYEGCIHGKQIHTDTHAYIYTHAHKRRYDDSIMIYSLPLILVLCSQRQNSKKRNWWLKSVIMNALKLASEYRCDRRNFGRDKQSQCRSILPDRWGISIEKFGAWQMKDGGSEVTDTSSFRPSQCDGVCWSATQCDALIRSRVGSAFGFVETLDRTLVIVWARNVDYQRITGPYGRRFTLLKRFYLVKSIGGD